MGTMFSLFKVLIAGSSTNTWNFRHLASHLVMESVYIKCQEETRLWKSDPVRLPTTQRCRSGTE